jgi:outer membrane autotransporter protein
VAGYAGGGWGNVRFRLGAAYTHHAIDTTRTPTFPGFVETVTARYGAGTVQAFGEAGYRLEVAGAGVEPFVGLAGIVEHTDGYTESGSLSALSGGAGTYGAFVATVGVRVSGEFVLGDGLKVKVHGSLAWEHAIAATATVTHAFAGGAPFTVAAAAEPPDSLNLELGAGLELAQNAHLDLTYAGRFSGATQSHAVKATLSVVF